MYTVVRSRLGYVLPKPFKFNHQRPSKISLIVGVQSFSHRAHTRRLLQVHNLGGGYYHGSSRKYGTIIFRAVKGLLKLRYLLLGGAITGGISLQKKYDEWKDALNVDKYMPSSERIDSFRNSLVDFKDKVKAIEIDPRIMKIGESKWSQTQEWLNKRIAEAYAAAEQRENESDKASRSRLLADAIAKVREEAENKVKVQALPFAQEAKPESDEKNPKSFWKFNQGAKGYFSWDWLLRFFAYRSRPKGGELKDTDKSVEALQKELMEVQLKYQKEIERLEKDNKELKKQLLLSKSHRIVQKQIKKSLIDMYSEVLDELSDYDASYSAQDHLPRVVVVGDQSSGKTSVLEMVAQARIFPRGAGEMMTRAPVKVTLSEGPYHIAQFKDSDREFDLTKEDDLRKLRTEVELRMKRSLSKGKTVSNEVISMTVKGPGLQRMVLVDLPGIISTVTRDMAEDTREAIRKMTIQHMSNPNSIILCIQDGSVDAERSNVTDLVAQVDPAGKRTIFVLTKVDLAEENLSNPQRIHKILSGRLFPMKALGYFAVVTGRGSKDESIPDIKNYEEHFFRNSKLFRDGRLSTTQLTTKNLSLAVSECFWKMVRETVEQQADAFKATRFNLETEWKNTFPGVREMDRDELFDKARGEILDEVINLSQVSVNHWESLLSKKLWDKTYPYFMDSIYIPAALSSNANKFNTMVDIRLKDWAESELAAKSIEAGTEALRHELVDFMQKSMNSKDGGDAIFDKFKKYVVMEALNRHKWEDKGNEMLRLIQLNTLEDRCINDKEAWASAVNLLEDCLKRKLQETEAGLKELIGPSTKEKWLYWKYPTELQNQRRQIKNELEKLVLSSPDHGPALTADEITAVKKNLQAMGAPEPTNELVYETWPVLFSKHFLQKNIDRAYSCRRGYYMYKISREEAECQDVVLFWRVEQMLKVTATALRQQVMNREARRLDKIIKDVLDDFSQDQELKVELLTGRRVLLAEELKRVRQIQEKLEEFIQALNKEK